MEHCDTSCKNIKKIVEIKMKFKELVNKYVESHNNYINNREKNQTLTIKHKNDSEQYYILIEDMMNRIRILSNEYDGEINKNNRIIKEQNKLIASKQSKLESNNSIIDKKNDTLVYKKASLEDNNNNNETLKNTIYKYIIINIVIVLFYMKFIK